MTYPNRMIINAKGQPPREIAVASFTHAAQIINSITRGDDYAAQFGGIVCERGDVATLFCGEDLIGHIIDGEVVSLKPQSVPLNDDHDIERYCTARVVEFALVQGYALSINDGEAWVLKRSTSLKDIIDALFSAEEDYIRLYKGEESEGTIQFVWGNAPDEALSGHGDRPAPNAMFEHYQTVFQELTHDMVV